MLQVNKSQEDWLDAQLALSTATPSLGGAPPKLNTLKIAYYQPHYDHHEDYDRLEACGLEDLKTSALCDFGLDGVDVVSKKSKGFVSMRGRSSLRKQRIAEEKEEESPNTVNVLSTTTEASMSSASFAIPRKSTIEADVSLDYAYRSPT